ncbi:DMT family transporter [Aestuariibius sp. 2305UL40-4]|uniref:DMT family transporter n=1 Tax=Aestuariibius violaceus TaxID=3234132 RepID=UPI00345E20A8
MTADPADPADPANSPTPVSAAPSPGAAFGVMAALFAFSLGPIGVVVQKWLVASFSPFLIVAIQATGGGVVLWFVRWLVFPKAAVPRRSILKGLALGALHPGAFMVVYTAASGRLDSVTAVLLLALGPAFVAIGGRLILKEALRPIVLVGIAVSMAGLVLLVSEREATGANTVAGFALGGVGLILTSAAMITGRAFNTGAVLPWFVLAPLQVTGGAAVAWAGVVVTGAEVDPGAVASEAPAFLYLILGMTAASYLAYNFALSRLTTPTLGLLAAGAPGVGALAASIIFDTPIGSMAAIGIAVILLGAALPPLWGIRGRWRRGGVRV